MADQSKSTSAKAEASAGPSGKIDAARERLQQVAGQLEDRYRQVSDEVRKGAEKASAELRRGAHAARERGTEAAAQLRKGYGRAREQARGLSKDVSDFVQEKPGTALLIAATAGFVIGLLVRRRGGGE